MNLSPRWVGVLGDAGIDAVHWSALGALNAADSEICDFARHHDFVILTQDLDFSAILSVTSRGKPSVVQIRADDLSPDQIGPKVIMALHRMSVELANGAILTVDPLRTRLRLLPLPERSGFAGGI
ncbi:DUF5615 family PIN-like protein [Thiorhodovibrio winogradskyi]|nr:DUF5615 family PIN-like protein [Thiorhodovibrio winogradskyi]